MDIKLIHTQRVLSPTQIKLADYVINPYRGCEFGCLYCYAQENKNIKKSGFLKSLGIKINAPLMLEEELKHKKPKRVLMGSTTECFQYQEPKYRISEKILVLLNSHNIPYTILTKSHLVKNYLPLISRNKENKIYFTLNFISDRISKLLEEKSPSLKNRLETIKEILNKGVNLRIHIGPFIPYLSCFTQRKYFRDSSELEKILKIIPGEVKEIDIELYHKKQGNFTEIIKRVEKNISGELSRKLNRVYESEENYIEFAEKLKEKIRHLNSLYPFKFYYLVPDFNKFYTSSIDYEKPFF